MTVESSEGMVGRREGGERVNGMETKIVDFSISYCEQF